MTGVRRLSSGIRRVDWLLASASLLAAELEVLIRFPQLSWQQELNAFAALALLGLAWLRRRPIFPTLLLTGSGVISVLLGARIPMVVPQLALLLATYSLGAFAGRRELGVGVLLPTAMAIAIDLLLPTPPVPLLNGVFWYGIFITGVPVLAGRLVRSRSRLLGQLAEQRTALIAERDARARQAVTAERQRIARELRGVVIKSVDSLIADVAVAESDPSEEGLAAVTRIESSARKALSEIRRLLRVLHQRDVEVPPPSEGAQPLAPQSTAGTDRGAALIGRFQAAVELTPWPIVVATLVLAGLELKLHGHAPARGPGLLVDASLVCIAAPIAWSRRQPLAAAAISLVAAGAISRLVIPISVDGWASAMLAFYLPFCVAALDDRRTALVGLGICALGFIWVYGLQSPPALVFGAGAWIAGRLLGDRTRLARELEAINRNLREERDLRAYESVLEERLRVARELHDVIGHTLTVVVLQAGAARRNWGADPTRVASAVASLAGVARGGLPDLLASLQALDVSSGSLPPIPGLGDIRALVEQARAAGVRVILSQQTLPAALSAELELTAYRVVQEALTNVMKYAPRSPTQVRIESCDGRVQVEVVNGGPLRSQRGRASDGGQGLRGMAQRVSAGGGELSWGRDELGGFAVQARLPIVV